MNAESIKNSIREFIESEFLPPGYPLKDNELLFDVGIIDSLGMIKLNIYIEEKFGVVINPSEITMDNFNTVEKIGKIIYEKKGDNV